MIKQSHAIIPPTTHLKIEQNPCTSRPISPEEWKRIGPPTEKKRSDARIPPISTTEQRRRGGIA